MSVRGPIRVDQHMAAAAAAILPATISDGLRTRLKQLPILLRTAGLAGTYAFLTGKSNDKELGSAYQAAATGIRTHLQRRSLVSASAAPSNEALLAALATLDPAGYARASAEVALLAGWLSRLAEARYQAARAAAPPGEGADTPAVS